MLDYNTSNKFDKDLIRLGKRGYDIEIVKETMRKIINNEELGYEYKKHVLEPRKRVPKHWEIHVGGRNSNVLMIYCYFQAETFVMFERVGTHSDLF